MRRIFGFQLSVLVQKTQLTQNHTICRRLISQRPLLRGASLLPSSFDRRMCSTTPQSSQDTNPSVDNSKTSPSSANDKAQTVTKKVDSLPTLSTKPLAEHLKTIKRKRLTRWEKVMSLTMPLARIRLRLDWFNESDFLEGARTGLTTIAKLNMIGDVESLQKYLSPEAYARLSSVQREKINSSAPEITILESDIVGAEADTNMTAAQRTFLIRVYYLYMFDTTENTADGETVPATGLFSVIWTWKAELNSLQQQDVEWKLDQTKTLDRVFMKKP